MALTLVAACFKFNFIRPSTFLALLTHNNSYGNLNPNRTINTLSLRNKLEVPLNDQKRQILKAAAVSLEMLSIKHIFSKINGKKWTFPTLRETNR